MSKNKLPRGYDIPYIGKVLPRKELIDFMEDGYYDDSETAIMCLKEKYVNEEGEE